MNLLNFLQSRVVKVMTHNNYLEPINFIYSDDFFKGFEHLTLENVKVIKSLSDAMELAFEQLLPKNSIVWSDFIDEIRLQLRNNSQFKEAQQIVDDYALLQQSENKKEYVEYRKKILKKENTKYDDFVYSEAKEHASHVLITLAIQRYLNETPCNSILEDLFTIIKQGGWPCGISRNNTIYVFNPKNLK